MDINKIKKIHIIGIGGCASSAIALYLSKNNIIVTGSEMKYRKGLEYLEDKGIKIFYQHNKNNLNYNNMLPDIVLFSPAVHALDRNNPELIYANEKNIPLFSWQQFIGNYLNSIGKIGITVSGSEGKGTTAGILTTILKNTQFDPLSILGAKIKKIDNNIDSNIYSGNGKTYILEADEYNRNFLNYHPSINIMINFQFEHPETYKDFNDYMNSFYDFMKNMNDPKILILRYTNTIINFIEKFNLNMTHKIIFFTDENNFDSKILNYEHYIIKNHKLDEKGNYFTLENKDFNCDFFIPSLPGYLVYNGTGAIIASIKLGLDIEIIKRNLLNFCGMVRRFDITKTKIGGIIITDYGHSPESINYVTNEIRKIYKNKKLHLIFQPHLFSRTYNFFNQFIDVLKKSDKITLIDIYPAREQEKDWIDKISSYKLYEELKKIKEYVYYAGKSSDIENSLIDKIDPAEITCFIGAGDMDLYYDKLIDKFI